MRVILYSILVCVLGAAPLLVRDLCAQGPPSPLEITQVSIDREIFHPTAGEQVKIRFHLSSPGQVSLQIIDADQDLVATPVQGVMMVAGDHTLPWDGKDQRGRLVPDEAYTFILDAAQGSHQAVYDPRTTSGGMLHEIERVKLLPASQQIEYQLPTTGRVSLRAGLVDGPLLAIPVDWEPRAKGLHREPWDGKDQEKLIEVMQRPNYQVRVTYYTLPENTIITRGNKSLPFLKYKQQSEAPLPLTPQKSSAVSGSVLRSPLFSKRLIFSKAPPLEISFPGATRNESHIVLLSSRFTVRAELPQRWQEALQSKLYEIYFFLNGKFLMEVPDIHLPYETAVNIKEYQPGLQVLTVNIIDMQGQVGIRSTQVYFP